MLASGLNVVRAVDAHVARRRHARPGHRRARQILRGSARWSRVKTGRGRCVAWAGLGRAQSYSAWAAPSSERLRVCSSCKATGANAARTALRFAAPHLVARLVDRLGAVAGNTQLLCQPRRQGHRKLTEGADPVEAAELGGLCLHCLVSGGTLPPSDVRFPVQTYSRCCQARRCSHRQYQATKLHRKLGACHEARLGFAATHLPHNQPAPLPRTCRQLIKTLSASLKSMAVKLLMMPSPTISCAQLSSASSTIALTPSSCAFSNTKRLPL